MKRYSQRKKRSLFLAFAMLFSVFSMNMVGVFAEEDTSFKGKTVRFLTQETAFYMEASLKSSHLERPIDSLPAQVTVENREVDTDGNVWYLLSTKGWNNNAEYPYVLATSVKLVDNPADTVLSGTVTYSGDKQITVCVTGELPQQDSKLNLEPVDIHDIPGFDLDTYPVNGTHLAMDISVSDYKGLWQPTGGSTVKVSLPASAFGLKDGDEFIVYHIHDDGTDTVEVETLGPYKSDGITASSEVSSFSTFIVENTTGKISGVSQYYDTACSGNNDHYQVIGTYFDENEEAHLLVQGKSGNSPEKEIKSVTVGDTKVDSPKPILHTGITLLEIYDVSNTRIKSIERNSATWYWDIPLGEITIPDRFNIEIITSAGGFDIKGAEVIVSIQYALEKTVNPVGSVDDKGTPVFSFGDEVIYQIIARNTDEYVTIMGTTITDTLPNGVFDPDQVFWSTDKTTWNKVTSSTITLANSNLTLEPGESAVYYVKATVLNPAAPGTYRNTASIYNANSCRVLDTADIVVEAHKTANLTIIKTGAEAIDGNQTFLFRVQGTDQYTNDINILVTVHGNGQTTITDLPVGNYTVTEDINWSWRYQPKGERSQKITLEVGVDNRLRFENERVKDQWLDGETSCMNLFTGKQS